MPLCSWLCLFHTDAHLCVHVGDKRDFGKGIFLVHRSALRGWKEALYILNLFYCFHFNKNFWKWYFQKVTSFWLIFLSRNIKSVISFAFYSDFLVLVWNETSKNKWHSRRQVLLEVRKSSGPRGAGACGFSGTQWNEGTEAWYIYLTQYKSILPSLETMFENADTRRNVLYSFTFSKQPLIYVPLPYTEFSQQVVVG